MTAAEPVAAPAADRLAVVDALRGFALLGIIVMHSWDEFRGFWPPEGYLNERFPFDQGVWLATFLLTFGKFFTIFSFLFGLGFAIQLERAARRSSSFAARFVRRLLILFVIGFVHSLFYTGDILGIYAVLGLLLLPVRDMPDKWLAGLGLLLVLNVPTHVRLAHKYLNPPAGEVLERELVRVAAFKQHIQAHFEVKTRGNLAEVTAFNLRHGPADRTFFQFVSGRVFLTMGLFLLGLWAGRRRLFTDTPVHRRFFRRLLVTGAVLTVLSTPLVFIEPPTLNPVVTLPALVSVVAFDWHQVAMSAVYLAGFTLLFWARPAGHLSRLVPVGRTGLTVYLAQSFFGVLLFYGCGLGQMGRLGTTLAILAGVAFFALQVWLADFWLRRFHYGPFEWLWRSLTEGRAQRLRLTPAPQLAAESVTD